MYRSKCVCEVYEEDLKLIGQSSEMTLDNYYKTSKFKRLGGKILKIFSPMM